MPRFRLNNIRTVVSRLVFRFPVMTREPVIKSTLNFMLWLTTAHLRFFRVCFVRRFGSLTSARFVRQALSFVFRRLYPVCHRKSLPPVFWQQAFVGGTTRNRTGDEGFADLCLTAWLWCHKPDKKSWLWSGRRDSDPRHLPWQGNALPLSHSRMSFYQRVIVYQISYQKSSDFPYVFWKFPIQTRFCGGFFAANLAGNSHKQQLCIVV